MIMRAPVSELPLMLVEARIVGRDVTILDDITLTIAAGPPTVLIGPNGSGKTTLLRAAMGLIPLSGGRVTWGGQEIAAPTKGAIVFQRPTMLRRTAAANVHFALAAAGDPRAQRHDDSAALLTLVGLDKLGARPARRLPGREQQRHRSSRGRRRGSPRAGLRRASC